jgi:hypothetical protein
MQGKVIMNVKLLLLTGLLCASSYNYPSLAMTAEEAIPIVYLVLNGKYISQIPAETAPMLGILQIADFDPKTRAFNLNGSNLDPAVIELISYILKAAYSQRAFTSQIPENGKGKMQEIIRGLRLPEKITPESLLSWSDYLNFTYGIYLATYWISKKINDPNQFLNFVTDLLERGIISKDAYDTMGKFLVLLSRYAKPGSRNATPGKDYLPHMKDPTFSIRDYLIYKPDALFPPNQSSDLDLFWRDLDLDSLEGFNEIPNLEKITSIDLSGNLLRKIDAYQFSQAINLESLFLGENQLEEIHPDAFQNYKLKFLSVRNNNLTSISLHLPNTAMFAIDLSDNKITFFDPTILKNMPKVKVILTGNPLQENIKDLLRKWNSYHAQEYITEFVGNLNKIELRPFIEFDGNPAPSSRIVAQPAEGQALQ